jgi:hypothetical protein
MAGPRRGISLLSILLRRSLVVFPVELCGAQDFPMRRREFITLLGGAAAAWPFATRAQQAGKVYRIGFLVNNPTILTTPAGAAFRDELREGGFVEGDNILIDWRFAEGKADRYAELAATLVRLRMDLIVTSGTLSAIAAKQATKTIPVVMMNVSDPVALGIVANLARPEGNITGVIEEDSPQFAAKRLQLLKDAAPQTAKVAVLLDPDSAIDQAQWQQLELLRSNEIISRMRCLSCAAVCISQIAGLSWSLQQNTAYQSCPVSRNLPRLAASCPMDPTGSIGSDAPRFMLERFSKAPNQATSQLSIR